MRKLSFLTVCLMLLPALSRAALTFSGRGPAVAGVVGLSWASVNGNSGTGTSLPIADLVSGVHLTSSLDHPLADGGLSGSNDMLFAASGPATTAAPICTYIMRSNATSTQNAYPRYAETYDPLALYLSPTVVGAPVHFAVRWNAIRTGAAGSTTWSVDHNGVIASGNGSGNGFVHGTIQGNNPSDYILRLTFSTQSRLDNGQIGTAEIETTFEVFVSETAIVGVAEAVPAKQMTVAAARPNPVRTQTVLAYSLPEPGDVRARVLDVTGRVVRTFDPGTLAAGPQELVWDRRDASGAPVRAGIYWTRWEYTHGGQREARAQRLVVMD